MLTRFSTIQTPNIKGQTTLLSFPEDPDMVGVLEGVSGFLVIPPLTVLARKAADGGLACVSSSHEHLLLRSPQHLED